MNKKSSSDNIVMYDCKHSIWNKGEVSRNPIMRRPCDCNTCKKGNHGAGYLSASNFRGQGFTVWIQDEKMYKRMLKVLGGEK